jgi:hypothetical protein
LDQFSLLHQYLLRFLRGQWALFFHLFQVDPFGQWALFFLFDLLGHSDPLPQY